MMFFTFFFCVVCTSLFVGSCLGTHFRGGHFWFRSKTPPVPNQIEIGFQLTWRMSYSPTTHCDRDVIDSGSLIGPETPGYLMCDVGCQGRVGDVSIRCLDYSVLGDWITGDRAYNHFFQGNGSYQVVWDGQGWFKDDVPWMFRLTLNLTLRSTTNGIRVNSSPRATLPPLPIAVERGCSTNIRIIVTDDDGDVVRCRWATSQLNECGGVCHDSSGVGQPIAILIQETCILQLYALQSPDVFILALQLEDFDPSDRDFHAPLSSVPLQFSIGLFSVNGTNTTTTTSAPTVANTSSSSSSSSGIRTTRGTAGPPGASWCQIGPVFVAPTPVDGSCQMMDRKRNISITIAAKAKDSVTIVYKIDSIGPTYDDVSQSEIAAGNGSTSYVIVSMTAADNVSLEDRAFCFQATDNFGFISNTTCFNITFGLHPPQATSSTFDASRRRVIITFNQSQIRRPLMTRMVNVYDDQDHLLASYDTTATDQVTFTSNTITMSPTDQMINSIVCYHIQLQPGAVLSFCGTPSLEVTNTTSLNFTTSQPVGARGQCGFTTGIQTTTTTTTTAATTADPTSSSSASNSSSSSVSPAAAASSASNGSSWDYRWLVVAVVCSVVLFAIIALVTAYVIRRAKSRDRDRRSRQERFFSTLNSSGIYNWNYDQQQQQQQRTRATPDATRTTDATAHT